MRIGQVAVLITLLVTAACAVQPSQQEVRPERDTTGAEADERMRARIHTELAAGYFELGNMSVALEEANVALRADPGYSPAYNIAGLIYSELKEDRLAEQNFAHALRMNPLDSDANNNYGWFLCQRKREAESIKFFLAALRNPLYQNPERTYVNAGLCARQHGDLAGAEQFFLSALKVRPAQPQALYQAADLAYARGDYASAKQHLERLAQVVQANAEVLWLGLRIERKLGDRNSEESYAHRLRNNFPDSKEAQALLAGQYE
ncbi:MAG: type IV pilus biogenesis/stability protein PilW [Betaproteobacteria bacterium]|nr:type IV pilus biogenesis/stability protein PilW [Betaproteobacteria bacterium]